MYSAWSVDEPLTAGVFYYICKLPTAILVGRIQQYSNKYFTGDNVH